MCFENRSNSATLFYASIAILTYSIIAVSEAQLAREVLDNDFESGSISPWMDESPGNVDWQIEKFSSPSETNSPVPPQSSGGSYLRATRNAYLSSGLAVFSTPNFTAYPGDKVSFDFWIRSKYPQGNSLELVWLMGSVETVLGDVSQYSTLNNNVWRSLTVELGSFNVSRSGRLVFYGYCGNNPEDAIAIDNIVVNQMFPSTTTTAKPTSPTPPPCNACSGIYNGSYGDITSPNYPEPYCNYLSCYYHLSVPTGLRIGLAFSAFRTEELYDVVRVYNGPSTGDELLGIFSGTNFTFPIYVKASGNEMLVHFSTDGANTETGWTARYGQY